MPNFLLHQGAVAGSLVASSLTLTRGIFVVKVAEQPRLPIRLYEYEASTYCRIVREALTALHLDVDIVPCPRGGTRFRPEVQKLGGKQQYPFLVDENTGRSMYESADIVEYLFRTYGDMEVPATYKPFVGKAKISTLVSAVRLGRGWNARASRCPEKPLHLTSFEGSPFSRLVRERMSELELPYTLHNLGKERFDELGPAVRRISHPYTPNEGGKRAAFFAAHGRVQVPYLQDPNTGTELFESAAIIDYLESTYAV